MGVSASTLGDLTVMILAAGRGERMRPLTDSVPKPLLQAGGKPLIVWHLERLAAWGVRRVVINHAHLGHLLEQALGNGSAWGLDIAWSPEEQALETAGGIAWAMPLLGERPFAVINGDVFCDLQPASVQAAFNQIERGDALAHLWLTGNPEHRPDGDFTLCPDGRVLPQPDSSRGLALTFSGIGLYRQALFAPVHRGSKAALAPLLRSAMDDGRVTGECLSGSWVDVGTPRRLAELDAELTATARVSRLNGQSASTQQ